MNETTGFLRAYFGVVAREETYLNLIYLILAFPLGTLYFCFLVTGLSVGIGTVIIWVGVPILLAVLAASWGLAIFERTLAISMLGEDVPPMSRDEEASKGAWERLKAHLRNPVTWTSMLYLIVKFPVATLFFSIAVSLVATSLGLLIAPFHYRFWDYPSWWGFWLIDTVGESLILTALALVVVGPISLHITNLMAKLSGALARVMLGRAES